jgi:hypothetical protein
MPDFSRNPSDYRPEPSGHFRRRFEERDIPGAVIQKAIEGGDVTEQDDGRLKLATSYLGYDFIVVIEPDNGYVVTAYSTDNWHANGDQQDPVCLTY